MDQHAAVHIQRDAGEITGQIAGEEQRSVGDVTGGPKAAERYPIENGVAAFIL